VARKNEPTEGEREKKRKKKRGPECTRAGKKEHKRRGETNKEKEKKNEEGRRFMNVYKLLRAQSC
jgi:hypothetical protein